MDLGLYRREHLHSGDANLLGAATVEQFQRTHAAINGWQAVEHTDDGRHGAITATSLTVSGRTTLTGGAVVTGPTTFAGDLSVQGGLGVTGPATIGGALAALGNATVAGTLAVGGAVSAAAYREAGRAVASGYWQDVPFSAANFRTSGPGTWTVSGAAVLANRYAIVGKLLTWKLYLAWFTGTSVLAGGVTTAVIGAPSGLVLPGPSFVRAALVLASTGEITAATILSAGGDGTITLTNLNGGALPDGTLGLVCTTVWETQ